MPLTSWSLPRLPWSRAPQGLCAEPAGAWHHSLADRGRPQLRPAGGNGGLLRGDDGGGPADRRHLTIKRSNKYAHRSLIKLPLITSTRLHRRMKLSSERESISRWFPWYVDNPDVARHRGRGQPSLTYYSG